MKFQNGYETNVVCPKCLPKVKLIVRTNSQNNSQFLTCPNWPDCDHTEEIPVSMKLKVVGQKGLFDDWLNEN